MVAAHDARQSEGRCDAASRSIIRRSGVMPAIKVMTPARIICTGNEIVEQAAVAPDRRRSCARCDVATACALIVAQHRIARPDRRRAPAHRGDLGYGRGIAQAEI